MFDRDCGTGRCNSGGNNRFSMISQSFIYKMEQGDTMAVKLHEGALKGGGSHIYTSFLGMKIGGNPNNQRIRPNFQQYPNFRNEVQN